MNRVLIPPSISQSGFRSPGVDPRIHELHGETMGTTWSVKLVAPPTPTLMTLKRGIQAELDRIVAQMSAWLPDSELARFNAAPADTWHDLSEDFFFVLKHALAIAAQSDGACDPTVGALVELWGFGPRPAGAPPYRDRPPTAGEVAAARERCGWQRLQIDRSRRRVRQPGGVALDLSAIAKGHGVDCVARHLQRAGVTSFLVEVGGELRGHGVKPDGMPWWVALEQPPGAANGNERTILALHGLAVATSGDYRRYFEFGGRRYAHSIDPRTGWPVVNRLASVTVIHPSCMQADALSTLLTVLGPDEGMDHARLHALAVLFVTRASDGGFAELLSPALASMLD